MSEFKNSQRHFYKATHAPIQLQSGEDMKKLTLKTRCFEKFSFIRLLAIHPTEIEDLLKGIKSDASASGQLHPVLDIVEDIAGESSPSTLLRHVHRSRAWATD